MNNDGFRTERTILDGVFNDIPQWNYGKITELIGRGKRLYCKDRRSVRIGIERSRKK